MCETRAGCKFGICSGFLNVKLSLQGDITVKETSWIMLNKEPQALVGFCYRGVHLQ